jgi:hypothetical protein
LILVRDKTFFFSRKHLDLTWGASSLGGGGMQLVCEVHHACPCGTGVNEWSYTSTVYLPGMQKDTFSFTVITVDTEFPCMCQLLFSDFIYFVLLYFPYFLTDLGEVW